MFFSSTQIESNQLYKKFNSSIQVFNNSPSNCE